MIIVNIFQSQKLISNLQVTASFPLRDKLSHVVSLECVVRICMSWPPGWGRMERLQMKVGTIGRVHEFTSFWTFGPTDVWKETKKTYRGNIFPPNKAKWKSAVVSIYAYARMPTPNIKRYRILPNVRLKRFFVWTVHCLTRQLLPVASRAV